jgi:Flp pilus assembly protein TadG
MTRDLICSFFLPVVLTDSKKSQVQPSAEGRPSSVFQWMISLLNSREEGASLVEMAVTMPVILLMMTGIFSISIALHQKMELAEAISAGGRFLAVDRGDTDPCATTATKIYAAAPTLTKSKVTLTFTLNGTVYSGATCSGTTNMVSGATASVKGSYPCSFGIYNLNLGSCTINEAAVEPIQ